MVTRRRFAKISGIIISVLVLIDLVGIILVGVRVFTPTVVSLEVLTPGLAEDTESPEITLNGETTVTVLAGKTYEDKGATVSDNADPVVLEISDNVDTTTPGTYSVKYQAVDFSGNHTIIKREVKVIPKKGTVYLTFDDGPSEYTASLLDVLKKYDVKATFFIINQGDDSLILREFNEGHALGSHTASHNYAYIYKNTDNFIGDLDAVKNRISALTGFTTNLMRFPGGSSNLISRRYDGYTRIMSKLTRLVTERGWTYFDWNVDSDDAGAARDPETVANNVISGIQDGGTFVVLQHDTKAYSVAAVEKIIQYGIENGFEFRKLESSSFDAHHRVNN